MIQSLLPILDRTTLASAASSVTLQVPESYELLFLEWHDVYGDNIAARNILLTYNSDGGGNYDHSRQLFGTASSTTNTAVSIPIGTIGDTDGVMWHNSGQMVIFNRDGSEKVGIGSEDNIHGDNNDIDGLHQENKWRTTSGVITTITLTASASSNFTAGSRFILRGISTVAASPVGGMNPEIVQFIGSADATGASVTLPTIPSGFERLWLFAHDVYGNSTSLRYPQITFNGDTGANYDYSGAAFGSASSTSNAQPNITVGDYSDTNGVKRHLHECLEISNRAGQEKVIIGTVVTHDDGGVSEDDVVGYHIEAKWRNKTDEIATITYTPSASDFAGSGKFYLFGLRI